MEDYLLKLTTVGYALEEARFMVHTMTLEKLDRQIEVAERCLMVLMGRNAS